MSFIHLPPELCINIIDFIPQSDSARLCLASRQLLSIVRPILYRQVSLHQANYIYDPDHESDPCDATPNPIDTTLSLLARDVELARAVQGLSLYAFPWELNHGRVVKSLINLEAMRNMTNLRKLGISGMIFRRGVIWDEEKEEKEVKETSAVFCEIIRDRGLEELVVMDSSTMGSGSEIEISAEQYALFGGLKRIEWASSCEPRLMENLTSLLSASRTTLETLKIEIIPFTPAPISAIFAVHVPGLRSLTFLSSGYRKRPFASFSQHYIDFLLSHSTLTHLDLGDWRLFRHNEGFSLKKYEQVIIRCPDAFPKLEFFHGDIESLQTMLRAGLRCLTGSGRLIKVVVGPSNTSRRYKEEMDAVVRVGGLIARLLESRVEVFRLYLGNIGDLGVGTDAIDAHWVEKGLKALSLSGVDVAEIGTDSQRKPEETFIEVTFSR